MNLEEKIKEEIYEYVLKFDLNEDELKEVDTYVLSLLNNFKIILNSHSKIINDKESVEKLKSMILESIRS
jgi:hypothetical protein|tara:strand:+ start:23779 stop:23988 length:210 start_codon:yes stop_codon:yes gene_type:complete